MLLHLKYNFITKNVTVLQYSVHACTNINYWLILGSSFLVYIHKRINDLRVEPIKTHNTNQVKYTRNSFLVNESNEALEGVSNNMYDNEEF